VAEFIIAYHYTTLQQKCVSTCTISIRKQLTPKVFFYTVSGKKSALFLNNFNKCKLTFIIFGTHYHNDTLY